jgi:cytoskeleton protein RodZ
MSEEIKSADNEVNELLQKLDFGAPLKRAREKASMSHIDVADELLISIDIIKALENSQIEALPAPAFTRGYIRSYARLLSVSADEILTDYVKMAPDSSHELSAHSILPVQKSSSDNVIKLVSYGFVVVALVVLIYWLYTTDFNVDSNADIKTAVAEFNKVEDEQNSQLQILELKPLSEPDPVEETQLEQEADTNEPPETTEIIDKSAVVNHDETAEVITAVEPDQLVLSALADSWCEIQDSTGKRLFYQLLNSGAEIKLLGIAPFSVFLGNAPRIRVEINNKIVDFDDLINTNSNVASIEINHDATVTKISNR